VVKCIVPLTHTDDGIQCSVGSEDSVVFEAKMPERQAPSCVQRRPACSAGVSPAGARARSPVAWIAGLRETETLKPIDKAIFGMVSESPGRNESERIGGLENDIAPKAESSTVGRRQYGWLQSGRSGQSLRRGGSGGTVTRAR
jgi:hypothetical protein